MSDDASDDAVAASKHHHFWSAEPFEVRLARLEEREAAMQRAVTTESRARQRDQQRTDDRITNVAGRVDRCITRETYDDRHEALAIRIAALEKLAANIQGRLIGIAIIGALFVATVSAFVTHLVAK